ncbi:TonB-dependent receptor [Parabacteroides bouchesdurhonensis]|uniref:TonB-dependent receptor n=1 Tax=Parabacteroides bouchesdurhonensis TaxID=1936995 RepID=UPI000E4DF990|nr:TonB-dependent receptor [Parabacteroides bouchesdurhonensis]RHJ95289.1 TonB-dependent receptor [Bacteroides sp. AM07-16]
MKNIYKKTCFFLFLLLLSTLPGLADNNEGSITGNITDKTSKEPLMGATIQLEGTTIGAVTDLDGNFTIPNIKPGLYKISIKYISYTPIELNNVTVSKGQKTVVNAEMTEASLALEGVVVVAQMRQNTDLAILKANKASLLVQSGISAQQIIRTQDRDASEVIRRIPGISIIDGKFVMVRGLAQRYNNVWINNGAVPSSEADSRAFSFDIIPSSQMDNMIVVKSPAPELPADFSGGFIKIKTKDVPDHNSFSFSVGGSINDQAHFRDFMYSPGSGTDFLGFDNGMRKMEGSYTSRLDNSDKTAIDQITHNGFNNNWAIKTKTPVADLRLNASLSHKFDLDNGKRLAVIAAVNYTNAYKSQLDMLNARYSLYDVVKDQSDYKNKYTDNVYSNDIRLGGMVNLTFMPNDQDKYELKNIVNQLGQSRYTTRNGILFNSGEYIQEQQEYFYSSRTTYNGQFTGTHNRDNSKLDWSIGYAYANKNQPDRRIINREENGFVGDSHEGEMHIDQNEMKRFFYRLDENIGSAALNYQYDFNIGNLHPALKVGAYAEYRNRTYNNRAFFYRWNIQNVPSGFEYMDVVNEILTPQYFGADKLYVYEDTDNRDSYKGNNILAAGYLGINIPMEKLDIYAGIRYEYNRMQLTSYTTIKDWKSKKYNYPTNHLFPSLNTSYKFNEQNQLRLAYGLSANRPEFREMSSSVYYDFDLFSSVMGNSNLKPAYIQNVDLRYEYYPTPNEVASVALFYKRFDNPIEWTYIDNGGSYTYTYVNAKSADNYGVEVEIKKNLDFIGLKDFSWNFNGAYINSKVHFEKGSQDKNRPMQGQSPYLINTGFFYQNDRYGINASALYNRIGKRIMEVGNADMTEGGSVNNDFPDTYELARNTIDLNFSKKFAKRWEVKASVRNLLGEKVTFIQYPKFYDSNNILQEREQITKQYKPGRNFFLTLSYNL